MAVRRLYEPLCIAFGTTVSSPTVPTYQLYDLPHKFTPRLYMESEDPNLVLREIGVWAGWEQAGSANTRSFLLDLLKDEDAHDNFLIREAGPTRFRRVRGIIVLTQKHLRIVRTKGSRLGGLRFQLTYQQACLVHGTKGARGPRERYFAQNHDCKSGSIVVVRAILFDTKAAACAWKQREKSKRRRQEQLKCMCPSSEMQSGQKKAKARPHQQQ